MNPRSMGLGVGAVVALGAVALFPRIAQAHAFLVTATPRPGAVVASSPRTVVAAFAESVDPRGSFLRVFEVGGDGAEVDRGNSTVSFSNAHMMSVSLPRLTRGRYLVMWFTVSLDDGHRAGGAFTFRVK